MIEILNSVVAVSFYTLFRIYSQQEIGGTYVSLLECLFYIGFQIPNTVVLILISYMHLYVIMLNLAYTIFYINSCWRNK